MVRYYNTWLEEVYSSNDATDEDVSTDAGTTGFSADSTSRGGPDIEYAASQGGLDFISSGRHVSMAGGDADDFAIEFGSDSDAGQDDNEQEEEDDPDEDEDEDGEDSEDEDESDSGSESEDESKKQAERAKTLAVPEPRRDRRTSHRPFRTVMYISMEYCEKRVSGAPSLLSSFVHETFPIQADYFSDASRSDSSKPVQGQD